MLVVVETMCMRWDDGENTIRMCVFSLVLVSGFGLVLVVVETMCMHWDDVYTEYLYRGGELGGYETPEELLQASSSRVSSLGR